MDVLVGLVLRHGLTMLGGYLISSGSFDASQAETVVGALTAILGVGLSIWSKRIALSK